MIFGRGQIGVYRQNELFHVIQHGKTHGNHSGNLGKMKSWKNEAPAVQYWCNYSIVAMTVVPLLLFPLPTNFPLSFLRHVSQLCGCSCRPQESRFVKRTISAIMSFLRWEHVKTVSVSQRAGPARCATERVGAVSCCSERGRPDDGRHHFSSGSRTEQTQFRP